jgi:signal transduction histidine kinase
VYNDSRPIAESMKNQLFKKFSRLDVPEKKMVKGTGLGLYITSMKNQLFKKFSRLDVPEKKMVKGTGLGLYITKQIVESHGGTIGVKPKEQGNSFIFTIRKE